MADILYYIAGNSDIRINGESIKDNYRPITRKLHEIIEHPNFNELYSCIFEKEGMAFRKRKPCIALSAEKNTIDVRRIDLPIFSKLWDKLSPKPDHVVIFITDQKNDYDQGDTLFAGALIKTWLLHLEKRSPEIILQRIEQDPSDYDGMVRYFSHYIQSNRKRLVAARFNYLALSSGTPAMVNSLALASIEYNFRYYYIARTIPPEVREVEFLSSLNKQRYAEILRALVLNFQYSAALKTINESPFRNEDELVRLIASLTCRINYNYAAALKEVRVLKTEETLPYVAELSDLASDDENAFLYEMIARIEIAYRMQDFHTAIALVFNVLENARVRLAYKYTGVLITPPDFKEWRDYIISSGLFSQEKVTELLKNPTSRVSIVEILKKVQKRSPDPLLQQAIDFLSKLENKVETQIGKYSIQDLRNYGPFAHGIHGMPMDDTVLQVIWPRYGFRQLLDELKDFVCQLTGQPMAENPFLAANRIIEFLLKEKSA
ncbi:MAG TPA: hypothetical protein PLN61_04440 [bacterium]|nr:hypothetical protein [bacterium]HQI47892.1 hypothetical protein [bacterium]HQJ66210.1 hypothetical protein [bacterium]